MAAFDLGHVDVDRLAVPAESAQVLTGNDDPLSEQPVWTQHGQLERNLAVTENEPSHLCVVRVVEAGPVGLHVCHGVDGALLFREQVQLLSHVLLHGRGQLSPIWYKPHRIGEPNSDALQEPSRDQRRRQTVPVRSQVNGEGEASHELSLESRVTPVPGQVALRGQPVVRAQDLPLLRRDRVLLVGQLPLAVLHERQVVHDTELEGHTLGLVALRLKGPGKDAGRGQPLLEADVELLPRLHQRVDQVDDREVLGAVGEPQGSESAALVEPGLDLVDLARQDEHGRLEQRGGVVELGQTPARGGPRGELGDGAEEVGASFDVADPVVLVLGGHRGHTFLNPLNRVLDVADLVVGVQLDELLSGQGTEVLELQPLADEARDEVHGDNVAHDCYS